MGVSQLWGARARAVPKSTTEANEGNLFLPIPSIWLTSGTDHARNPGQMYVYVDLRCMRESDNSRFIITQSALEFCPIHCPNGRLGQDLGFGGIAFALKLPELLNRNLAAVRAKLGQRSCFP